MLRNARRGIVVAACLALIATNAACSDDAPSSSGGGGTAAAVPGVTDTEITLGTHMPLTGPAAAGYSKIAPASKAFFDYVNANGGVNGRKIKYLIEDDGYNPANTQTVVRKLVLEDKVFAILNGLGTPTHTGVLDFLKTQKVPDLFVASGSRSWNQPEKYPTTFGYQPDYTVEGKIIADYVKKNFPGQVVCHMGQDDDFGRDSLAGVEQVLGADGVKSKQKYVTSNTNITPQIQAFKTAGCQVVISATIPAFTALSLGTAAKIAFKPQWIPSSVGADYTTLSGLLGPGKALLEGLIAPGYLPVSTDSANPWIQLFQKVNKEYNGNAPFDGNIVFGMNVAYLTVQALLKAGKDLTRENLLAAVESGGFKNAAVGPYRYSKTDHSGIGGMQMGKVTGGVQAAFGPVVQTDDAAGQVTEYTEAAAPPPANGIPTV
ncbi:ABC transporter substrate-binding protein [Asanoa sp. NPDC049573]|uniref:ABC transporter substrate-binding protein n=1 Tax=Asanoa sp. NPDC049573 TaxID=3155396 RepID=UPI0034346B57